MMMIVRDHESMKVVTVVIVVVAIVKTIHITKIVVIK